MKKIILISLIVIVFIISICFIISNSNNLSNNDLNEQNYILLEDLEQEKFELNAEVDYFFPRDDMESMAKYADCIIVGKVKNIERQYWDEQLKDTVTIGNIEVKKVFKGKLKQNTEISFVREGGIISLAEFEKFLNQRERIQFKNFTVEEKAKWYGLDKFTDEEKDRIYVFDAGKGDIPIENEKIYLMYLKYNEKLDKYQIEYQQYGLREVDSSQFIWNYKYINVKDNNTGKFVKVQKILPKELM